MGKASRRKKEKKAWPEGLPAGSKRMRYDLNPDRTISYAYRMVQSILDELSKAWGKISGANIVDIREIKNEDKWEGVREVVKYPAKCANFVESPELVEEYLQATKGLKMVTGFGSLYRVRTRQHCDSILKCPRCGSIKFDWLNKISVANDRV